jgi:hypothetical protein
MAVFICTAVALYAFVNNPKNKINITWGILSLFVGLLSFGWGMIIASNDLGQANFWLKITFLGGFFIPSAFLDFVYRSLLIKRRELIATSYLVSIALFIIYLFGFVAYIKFDPVLGFFWWKGKFLYNFYVFHLLLAATYGEYLLYKELLKSYGVRKAQILYLVAATLIGFFGGATVFLPAYDVPIIPFGVYLFPLYPVVVMYAIVKYRLMDISFVIRKGLVYSLTLGIFTGVYISGIFFFGQVLRGLTIGASWLLPLVAIITFSVLFQPLNNYIQARIDRLFFKEKYNYQKTLKELSQAAAALADIDNLLHKISRTIVDRIKIDQCSIYCYDRANLAFRPKEAYNIEDADRN